MYNFILILHKQGKQETTYRQKLKEAKETSKYQPNIIKITVCVHNLNTSSNLHKFNLFAHVQCETRTSTFLKLLFAI